MMARTEGEGLRLRKVLPILMLLLISRPAWAGTVVGETSEGGVQRAKIVVDSYSYEPDHLVVQAGVPMELTLKSVTWLIPHSFVLKAPEAGLDIDREIGAGDTVTVRFTPTRPGKFKFFCGKKLLFLKSHRDRGMEGILEVR
jgi:plastocyanin